MEVVNGGRTDCLVGRVTGVGDVVNDEVLMSWAEGDRMEPEEVGIML